MMNNILAISGSLRQGSSNHVILQFLKTQLPAGINYHIYNELAQIPAFDPGMDNDTPPVQISLLRTLIGEADGIIISTPEYAFGVPGALKNMLDWLVSSSTLVDKPVALITASLGGELAHASLLLTLGALTAKLSDETNLLIQFVRSKVTAEGDIADGETVKNLQALSHYFVNSL